MEPAVKDASHLYEVERRARHAERPGFRITELQISPAQQVPWHAHTRIQDTFYVLEGEVRLSLHDPAEDVRLALREQKAEAETHRRVQPVLGDAHRPQDG